MGIQRARVNLQNAFPEPQKAASEQSVGRGMAVVKSVPDGTDSKLDELAKSLSSVGQAEERKLRGPLLKALKALDGAEREARVSAALVGEQFDPYVQLFKKHKRDKGPVRNFRHIVAALPFGSKSRAYRCLTAFKVAGIPGMLEAGEAAGIDLTIQKWSKLANRIKVESKAGSARAELPADELLAYCRTAMESEREAGKAPTVAKVTGPLPIRSAGSGIPRDYAAEIESLKAEYRKRIGDAAQADATISQVIIAALQAQIGKLPERRAA